jgi:aminopeptidase YwaD
MKIINELLSDVSVLCKNGPRFVDTTGDASAAFWVAQRLKEYGLIVDMQKFQLMGWKLNTDPELRIKLQGEKWHEVECLPFVYSGATSKDGILGILKYVGKHPAGNMKKFRIFERENFLWNKYAIVDSNGDYLAQIISRDYPENAQVAAWGVLEPPLTLPTVMVNGQAGKLFESMIKKNISVYLKVDTTFNPSALSFNLVGSEPSEEVAKLHDTVLVTAHYDSQYNTVGAVDNATGVACLLALSKRWKKIKSGRQLRFVAFGAEEIGLIGAKYYLNSLKEKGELNRIAAILNLDMLGCNQPNWVHVSDDDMVVSVVRTSLQELKIDQKYSGYELVCPPWPTGDQDPFYEQNIPTINLTWKGYLYPHTHRPDDNIDKIDHTVLEDSFYLAEKVLCSLSSI